jgi:Tol biopolymer transport system component
MRILKLAFTALLLLSPATLAAQEKIAFMSQRDGNGEIYVMNADGTNQLRLTFNPAFDSEPAFSRAGDKIAFMSFRDGNAEIYIMHADGSSQTRLTNHPGSDAQPAFSPDGSKIAFVSTRSGQVSIWLMNVDGSNPVELFDGIGGAEPEFSPDGTKIVFGGNGGSGSDTEVWTMNADGTGRNNISQDALSFEYSPSFSQDGTKIVYFRDPRMGSPQPGIYMMNLDGSNKVNISNNGGVDQNPAYSPDGTRIVFESFRDNNAEIYVMDVDGTHQTNLTNHNGTDTSPSWGAANSVPVLSNVVVSSPINEGSVATLSGEITDANASDSFVLTIAWGDGQSQTLDYPAGTNSFEVTHVYADDPPAGSPTDDYAITYSINDHRFGTDSGSKSVTVNNVNPTLSNVAVSPSPASVGQTVTVSGNYTDLGYHGSPADEQLQVFVTWGDGQSTSVVTTGSPGAINATHQYGAPGDYTITVQVSDNDGGVTSEPLAVVVTTPPPAAPTGLTVQSVSTNQVGLGWMDNSNNETGFAIERCSKRTCTDFVEIATVGANVTAFVDNTVERNVQYSYRTRSFNSGGVSSYSNVVSVKTPRN